MKKKLSFFLLFYLVFGLVNSNHAFSDEVKMMSINTRIDFTCYIGGYYEIPLKSPVEKYYRCKTRVNSAGWRYITDKNTCRAVDTGRLIKEELCNYFIDRAKALCAEYKKNHSFYKNSTRAKLHTGVRSISPTENVIPWGNIWCEREIWF